MKLIKSHSMWDYAWEKHDQVKNLFTNTFRPFTLLEKEKSTSHSNEEIEVKEQKDHLPPKRSYTTTQKVGLLLGPLLFLLTLFVFSFDGLSYEGRAVLASTLWVATWWVTEAIPIPVTSILPVVLFPLTNAMPMADATVSYSDNIIFLIMGGFVIALAMEKWNLHKRIALTIVAFCGSSTERVILGFVAATGFLSMWISNTAATMLMVPIALAIVHQMADTFKNDPNVDTSTGNFTFGKALMLSIAYAASMGGIATLVGSPANAIMVAIINQMYGVTITFAQWMLFAAPVSLLFMLMIYLYIIKIAFPMKVKQLPGGKDLLEKQKKELGKISYEEGVVGLIFAVTAFAWITQSFLLSSFIPGINDSIIAVVAAAVLFIIPARSFPGKKIFDWESAKNLPWGIALLYGCGLAIANGFVSTGLSEWMGAQLATLNALPLFVFLLILVGFTTFLTELTSNGATATMMFPIMGALALAMDVHPYVLIVAALLAATCAFMLPVSTPPNAVVFATGYIKLKDMAKTGIWLNLTFIVTITLIVYFFLPLVWGINIHEFPTDLR